jgi:hypothetical protein
MSHDAFNVVVEDEAFKLKKLAELSTQIRTGEGPFCYRCIEDIQYAAPCFVSRIPSVSGKCEEHRC